MPRATFLCRVALLLLLFVSVARAGEHPLWRIDLHELQSQRPRDEITIQYSGRYLVVFAGHTVYSGSDIVWVREAKLVIDNNGKPVPMEEWRGLWAPFWDVCPRTRMRTGTADIIDCRRDMMIQSTHGIGRGEVEPAEFYLLEPGKEKALIFRAQKRCQPGDPRFISDEYILLRPCNNNLVVDKKGKKVYDLPNLGWYYFTVNRAGTRFAVYERDSTFFHQLEGTTNLLRVRVFRSSDGKLLFNTRWHTGDYERTHDRRIALSDDGTQLAVIREEELLVFKMPAEK